MARKKTLLYPGTDEVERIKDRASKAYPAMRDAVPEMIDMAPNYDAFKGWTTEEVLRWLNID